MGRRIEVELTSTRDDGSWTWRVAGARQPKGELPGSLLYEGARVGDVVKAEAEFHVDGIELIEVFAPRKKEQRTDLLEMKSRPLRDDELVTTQRVARDGRRNRRERDGRRGRRDDGPRTRVSHDAEPPRPKPKRLRPRRTHRDALLSGVAEEHRPIVEQVLADGMPGVRAAIDKQNAEAKEAGKPEVDAAPILSIAEKHLQKARLAEWRDRADAALDGAAELDLRDLRSVVVAGNDIARDAESREVADRLKAALDERVEADHTNWLADLDSAVTDGRVVRALRLSSRPVKAGAPLPPDLASTLAGQASEALAADVGQERWATVLDALAFSPVRGAVTPLGIPPEPKAELLDAVKRLSDRVPAIAALFGIDPAEVPASARRRRVGRDRPRGERGAGGGSKERPGGQSKPRNDRPRGAARPEKADATPAGTTPDDAAAVEEPTPVDPTLVETPAAEPAIEEPTAETSTDEAPATEQAPVAEPPAEQPAAEAPATDEAPVAESATEEPTADAETSTDEEPATEQAPVAEPPAEEPTADTGTETSTDEEPATEQAPVAEPAAEEPATDEAPAAEQAPVVEVDGPAPAEHAAPEVEVVEQQA